jgi:hypothetical protein
MAFSAFYAIETSKQFFITMEGADLLSYPFIPEGIVVKAKPRDITENVFGLLTAKQCTGKHKSGSLLWLCVCECGGSKTVPSSRLLSGKVHSCGCSRSRVKSQWHIDNTTWNKGVVYQVKGDAEHYRSRKAWHNAVVKRFGNRCQQCGWDKASCDVHHRTPRSSGGENTIENAIVLCPNCHRVAHKIGDLND